jgi:hypothetical protein
MRLTVRDNRTRAQDMPLSGLPPERSELWMRSFRVMLLVVLYLRPVFPVRRNSVVFRDTGRNCCRAFNSLKTDCAQETPEPSTGDRCRAPCDVVPLGGHRSQVPPSLDQHARLLSNDWPSLALPQRAVPPSLKGSTTGTLDSSPS